MLCPVCGTSLFEGSSSCPQCGAVFNANSTPENSIPQTPTSQNPMPMNAPTDLNQGISVPKDFKLAGSNTDTNGDELPDGIASLLGVQEDDKAPVPKKKKRRNQIIKTILFMIVGVIILAIIIIFIFGLLPEKKSFDLICTRTDNSDGIITEAEYKFSNQGGFFNSDNKIVMSKQDGSSFTLEDRNNMEQEIGTVGFDQKVELENGKIVITYTNSHYNVSSVEQVKKESENSGAKCK